MNKTDKIAHIRKSDKCIQSIYEHALGVAELAEKFTSEIGMPQWGHYMGMLHDKGKEKKDFQTYIKVCNDLPTTTRLYGDKTHAYVGALLAKKYFPKGYPFVSYALAGHHSGMPDYTQLQVLLERNLPNEITEEDIPNSPLLPTYSVPIQKSDINHIYRMLYSCLVDADYLDTEAFMNIEQAQLRPHGSSLQTLLLLLEERLKELSENCADTVVNRIRKKIQDECRLAGDKPSGIYSMTVPTGGGKTLSSVLWALLHAIHNQKKRIIISIPYTSIITQTAAELKQIFGKENVLEHHSNLQISDKDDDETEIGKKLAAENWDFPIIVTTNVQLLESMYSSHPASCRKLHNIANSVIIFDEIQTLSGERLQPIINALKTYHRLFGISLLFTTASQPTLEGIRPGHSKDLNGFEHIEEIIPENWKLHESLKRVNISFNENPMSYEAIANKLMKQQRVLCIVNTRKDASELYARLPKASNTERHFHLSRMMCAEHIDSTIRQIKDLLKRDNTTPIRVISTQLIEAGVDIDFPVVYRQETGLDSILQAAGRCNREGKLPQLGYTEVFKIEGRRVPVGTLSFANQARINMKVPSDWFSPEAIRDYFTHFYHQIPTFDKGININSCDYTIEFMLENNLQELMFDTADKAFKLIENNGISVIVNFENSSSLISQLKRGEINKNIFRKLNRYTVNITQTDFKECLSTGMIEAVGNLYYLTDKQQYDPNVGLKTNNYLAEETLII